MFLNVLKQIGEQKFNECNSSESNKFQFRDIYDDHSQKKAMTCFISSPSYPYNVFFLLIFLLIICSYFRHEYKKKQPFFFSTFQLLLKITATKDWRMKEAPNRGHFPTSTQLIPNDNLCGAQIEEILHKSQTFFIHLEIYQKVLINRSWHLDI